MISSLLRNRLLHSTHCVKSIVLSCNNYSSSNVPVKEIKIPTQWGHVAAKLWGNENKRPILALHGWQDNAGTWDPLAPMLANDLTILAIDFPGHGFSSWYPPGMHYYAWEWPNLILYLKEYFKWDKITFLCHSMGSIAGCRYASLFPDDVDGYIAVENLIADDYDLNCILERYPLYIKKLLKAQSLLDSEPPTYTEEDLKKVWHLGTRKSVALENVHHLMKRGAKQSKADPNKYYVSRDSRLKYILFNPEDKLFVEAVISQLKCPTMYVKGTDSMYSTDPFSVKMMEEIKNNNDKFECHYVKGTHHLHLNSPEIMAPLVVSFLKKHNLYDREEINFKY